MFTVLRQMFRLWFGQDHIRSARIRLNSVPAEVQLLDSRVLLTPVVSVPGPEPTFIAGGPPVIVTSTLTVTDLASPTLAGATVTLVNPPDHAAEVLAVATTGSILANYANNTLTLTGTDTLANYQQVLASLTYADNAAQVIAFPSRTLSITVNDGTQLSTPVSVTIAIAVPPSQAWTHLTTRPPNHADPENSLLLPNGDVMVHVIDNGPVNFGTSANWYLVTPDANGQYQDGTWSQLASMNVARQFFGSVVLPNGNVFVVGGEYSSDHGGGSSTSAEIYNPKNDTWTMVASDPVNFLGDATAEVLSNGTILVGDTQDAGTEIYHPATNTWTAGGAKIGLGENNDEESWVKLPNGDILSYDIYASVNDNVGKAELYDPTTNMWTDASNGTLPILTSEAQGDELGPALMLPDGRALFTGATGLTAFFDTSTNTWSPGPSMPTVIINSVATQLTLGDAPAAIMPNGDVLMALSPAVTNTQGKVFPGPTYLYDFNPTSGVYTDVTPSPSFTAFNQTVNSFNDSMLLLPNGQVMVDSLGPEVALYTPNGAPSPAWLPTITSITNNGNFNYTLTGTQLNGLNEGAAYGDDEQMASNYPIVRVTDTVTHNSYYATTSNWSSFGIATGNTPETVNVALPSVLGTDPFSLTVITNGISSAPFLPSAFLTLNIPNSVSVTQNSTLSFTGGNAISVTDTGGTAEQLSLSVQHGTLTLATSGLVSNGNGTGLVTLTGSLFSLNNDLASLIYTPTPGYHGPDTLTLSDKDITDNLTAIANLTITVHSLSPELTAPVAVSVNQESALPFTGINSISVGDTQATIGTTEQMSLSVQNGTLTLGTTTGLTVTGNGSGSVTLTGSLASLNADLGSLSYTSNVGYHGSDTLSLSDKDTTSNLSGSASVAMTVNPVPPTVTMPISVYIDKNSLLAFTGPNAVVLNDKSGTAEVLDVQSPNGTLTFGSTTGLTAVMHTAGFYTLTGSLSSINAALATLTYTPTAGFHGFDFLELSDKDTTDNLTVDVEMGIHVKRWREFRRDHFG